MAAPPPDPEVRTSSPLGCVVDPAALEDASRPDARAAMLEVSVPVEWLAEGAALEISAPRLLACARCEGGGCDTCGRKGAHRTPDGASPLEVVLSPDFPPGGCVRMLAPWGSEGPEVLQVRVRVGDHSASVRRTSTVTRAAPPQALGLYASGLLALGAALFLAWRLASGCG